MNLAIVSPSNNAYSETFIQAHKELLPFNNFFYYGGYIPNALEGEGKLVNKKLSLPLRAYNYIVNSKKKYINYTEEAFAESLLKNNINCVLAEYGITGGKLTPLCKKLNIPLVVFFHGYDAYKKDILESHISSYRVMFDYVSKIFVVSHAMYNQLLSLGCYKSKLIINTYGPSNDFLSVKPKFRKKNIVAIGRFVDKKAPYFTILAFQKVLALHPDAELNIAGDGFLLNTCINLARYLKIDHKVNFIGVISPERFKSLLTDSSLFVQHSMTALSGDSEGTPVSVLEAQAAGVPVVATRHAGIPDVVVDGKTGYLVEEGDVDGMAQKISDVLSNFEGARMMGDEGRRRINEHFTMQRHIQVLGDHIKESVSD